MASFSNEIVIYLLNFYRNLSMQKEKNIYTTYQTYMADKGRLDSIL